MKHKVKSLSVEQVLKNRCSKYKFLNIDMKTFIVAGGRNFNDEDMIYKALNKVFEGENNFRIISGGATGVDSVAKKYAIEKGIDFKEFPANWSEFGRRAGFVRNTEMALHGTDLIAFWDGKSKGTKMMIEIAQKHTINISLFKIPEFGI